MTRRSVPIALLGLLATVAAGFLVTGQRSVDAGTARCSWNRIPATPTPQPSTTVLDQSGFVDRYGDGVPDRWGSSTDYARDGCERVTARRGNDSVVRQVIHPAATNPNAERDESADVSIQRVYRAPPARSTPHGQT
jgi:hypothetical protein